MSEQYIPTIGFCVVIFAGQYFKARLAKGCVGCVLTWCSGGDIRRCFRGIGALIHIINSKNPGLLITIQTLVGPEAVAGDL